MTQLTITNEQVNLLRANARSVVRELGLLNDAYFEIGVTLAERHLLIELSTSLYPTVGEVAERLLLDKSTASRLIAKAVKKGYVKCSADKSDKRKRFLQLTPLGKKTLETFEPIAFEQTKGALLTLSTDEVETVYRGVELYAKGLKNARLLQETTKSTLETLPELREKLRKLGYTLDLFENKDTDALYEIFREVVDSGSQFPYESSSRDEFQRQFFGAHTNVYVCHALDGSVVGGFYIKPNYSGRSGHIANAAYMITSHYRGKGIGALLVKASLHLAKESGFHGMQFNMVLSQNGVAIKLYQKLGFSIVGTVPEAVRNSDGTYQDGYIMYYNIKEQL